MKVDISKNSIRNYPKVFSQKKNLSFFDVVSKLQQPPEQLLEEMKPSPSFIIADSQRARTRAHTKKKAP